MSRSVDPTADAARYAAERARQGYAYDRHENAAWSQGVSPEKRRLRMSTGAIIILILGLVSIPLTLSSAIMYLVLVPDFIGIGMLFAALYLLVGTFIFRASPMWPRAGWLWYCSSLLWGGSVSLLFVFLFAGSISSLMDKFGLELVSASFAGAYPEEIAKGLGVLLILYAFPQLHRPWHGFVTGGLVGLGFEVFENLLYGGLGGLNDPNTDFDGVLMTWILRSVAGPGLHVFLTAITGYAIGYALYTYGISRGRRIGVALGGLAIAFVLHFAWNLTWGNSLLQIINMIVVGGLLYGIALYLWIKAHTAAQADTGVIYMHQPIMDIAQLPLSIAGLHSSVGPHTAPANDAVTIDPTTITQPAAQPPAQPHPQTHPQPGAQWPGAQWPGAQ